MGDRGGRANGSWASSPASRRVMQANRRRDTSPELHVRRLLHARGLRYRVDAAPVKGLRRRADLVFGPARVAVFVDGCFWHACPEHGTRPATHADYWTTKLDRNVRRDRETDRLLAEAGWTVIRVWEHEPAENAAARIEAVVRAARASGSARGVVADEG